MIFTWDINKAKENILNHGISFDEAKNVLLDPDVEILLDEEHSDIIEIRYKAIGWSGSHNLCVVFTVLDEDLEVIRIISAWKEKADNGRT